MSVEVFCRNLPGLPLGKSDRKWFPRWIRRYATHMRRGTIDPLTVAESEVIRFLQTLRDNDVPAWQRLQAARGCDGVPIHLRFEPSHIRQPDACRAPKHRPCPVE